MLAEIYMARAESLARASKEMPPASSSPFVAFDGTVHFKFKGSSTNGLRREIVRASADRSLMSGVNLNAGSSQ
jgi:hypothetical protein